MKEIAEVDAVQVDGNLETALIFLLPGPAIGWNWLGTGYKMLSVSFVFSMPRFQGSAYRCDKIVVNSNI